MIKRILIVGSDEQWSLERIYIKYLKELGVETMHYPAQSIFYKFYYKSIFNKLLFKSGLSGIFKKISNGLLKQASEFKPDLIWFFKGMEIEPGMLKQLKKQDYFLVNYNPDNPFYFSGTGSGNRNISASIGIYNLHLSYDREIRDRITREFKVPCEMLPFGFELSDKLYEECRKQEEVVKLCFLGNPDRNRVQFIEKLADSLPVDVYGNDWDKYTSHPNIKCFGPVYQDGFWKTLYRYRVQLNIMRPHNPASHNMRSFEIAGVGGIGLYPNTPDHRDYWKDEYIIFLYNNVEDCADRAKSLLNLHKEDATKIRDRARSHSLKQGHSYAQRTRQVLDIFNRYTASK